LDVGKNFFIIRGELQGFAQAGTCLGKLIVFIISPAQGIQVGRVFRLQVDCLFTQGGRFGRVYFFVRINIAQAVKGIGVIRVDFQGPFKIADTLGDFVLGISGIT
jgi:hypothetical protein